MIDAYAAASIALALFAIGCFLGHAAGYGRGLRSRPGIRRGVRRPE